MKADVIQRLAAINKKLTVLQPGLSESQNMSGSPPSPLNQNVVENGATSSSVNPARVKLPRLEVRKFSGKLEEWQEFWDSFESAIHSNDSRKVEQLGVVIPRLHSCVFHWTQALWKKVSEQVIILENGREKYVNFYVKADIDGRVLRYSFSVLVENI